MYVAMSVCMYVLVDSSCVRPFFSVKCIKMTAHHRDLMAIVELQIRQVSKLFGVCASGVGFEGSFR